jgi:hypothetical protein
MHIGYWWEIQKKRDHWEDQDVGGWTILKRILERWDGMEAICCKPEVREFDSHEVTGFFQFT